MVKTNGAWVVGHNEHDRMRDSDAEYCTRATWAEGLAALGEHALDYAGADDQKTRAELNDSANLDDYPDFAENGYGDDEPGMEGNIRAAVADIRTSGGLENQRVWFTAEDGAGRRIEFWCEWQDGRTSEEN